MTDWTGKTYAYCAELNTEDAIGGLFVGATPWVPTPEQAHADALALADCTTIGEATNRGVAKTTDERVHPDALLRSFRVVRHHIDGRTVGDPDDTYPGITGTYKAALVGAGA